jgi:8-oxo-dGTP pyrophosphatase MutT (NUDIX family)
LIENLSRYLEMTSKQMEGGEDNHSNNLIVYNPQDDFLKLLMCGDGTALGFRFGIPIYGKWVWHLKDYIDNKFMNLFRIIPRKEFSIVAMDERHYSLVFCRRIGPESGKREVLLGMKKRGFGIDKWNGYGGKQELGESMVQCAVRELEEESGIQLSEDLMTSIGYLHFTMRESKKIMHVHVFETYVSGDICAVETDEMRPRWYQEDCIPFEDMWADDPLWFPLFLSGQHFNGKIVFSDDSTIVNHEISPTGSNDKIDCKNKYDISPYDRECEVVTERMKAEDACKLLQRRDDEVDFQTAWSVIREMISDKEYKDDVLNEINISPDAWWKELLSSTEVSQKDTSVGQMLGGLIFLKTNIRNTLVDFYAQRIGMSPWLEQPNISIMKHGNMILGFHQITKKSDMGHPDLHGMITFVYPSTEQVDEMYQKLLDIADGKPRYNDRYRIYQFFAYDPEGRNLEFQAFLHPLMEVSSRPTD